jgi:hypothetical protein
MTISPLVGFRQDRPRETHARAATLPRAQSDFPTPTRIYFLLIGRHAEFQYRHDRRQRPLPENSPMAAHRRAAPPFGMRNRIFDDR